MKPLFLLPFLLCCLALGGWAQSTPIAQRLNLQTITVPTYVWDSLSQRPLVFPMAFASSRINQAVSWQEGQKFRQIDLVFTLYPVRPEDWAVGYDSLLARRFRALEGRIPQAFQDPAIRWRLVIQTACTSLTQAQSMMHAFVCYPANDTIPTVPIGQEDEQWTYLPAPRFDSTELHENVETVRQLLAGTLATPDSTVLRVLDRHPEWQDAVVVMDWTASMYRQGALVLRWQEQAPGRVRHLVFFNDGDQKQDTAKKVGETGGIYHAEADSIAALMPVVEAVTLGGEGGDHRENDLEAVLEGLAMCPDCRAVVLIADNTGPVRDMALLPLVDRPVHILLCGVVHDALETDYLDIADATGGSIHTRDRDLPDPGTQIVRGILTFGETQYTRQNGRWREYKGRY